MYSPKLRQPPGRDAVPGVLLRGCEPRLRRDPLRVSGVKNATNLRL
jgi:hypothetical protein